MRILRQIFGALYRFVRGRQPEPTPLPNEPVRPTRWSRSVVAISRWSGPERPPPMRWKDCNPRTRAVFKAELTCSGGHGGQSPQVRAMQDRNLTCGGAIVAGMILERSWIRISTLIICATIFRASQAASETLSEAVAAAYESNPGLLARFATQRALDETYVQARAGWRPTLGAQVVISGNRENLGSGQGAELLTDATGNLIPVGGGGSYAYNSGNATLQASQPIYTGGRVRAAVDAAEADILAGRQDLRNAELQLVQSVVQAYADVRRDGEVAAVRRENLTLLNQQVEQAQAKVELGQATQIDLAQSRAQRAAARSQLTSALGQLQISRAAYLAVVGHPAQGLGAEDGLPGLPTRLDEAFDAAEAESPVLLQAQYTEQAARFRVAQARAAKRPSVTANLSVGYIGAVAPLVTDRFDRAVAGTLTVSQPFYSGGVVSSQIHQALERDTADRLAVESAKRNVVQNVSQTWSQLETARANVDSNTEQVKSAQLAFDGLREQNRFGTATTLDLLIQQQQFRDAQLALIQASHDYLVAQAGVLTAIGRLSVARISPQTRLYDPSNNFGWIDRSTRLLLEAIPAGLDRIGAPSR